MPIRHVIIGIILLSFTALSLSIVPAANAAGTVSIIGANVNEIDLEPVNILSTGIDFTFTASPQNSNSICWPIKETVNSSSVSLASPSDPRNHPLYTLSWSKTAQTISSGTSSTNYFKFNLKIPHSGYELLPNSQYILTFKGGSAGIEFTCIDDIANSSSQNFYLSSDVMYKFKTSADDVTPLITEHSFMNTHNAAVFGWITSESAKTQISYGINPGLGTTKSVPGNHEKHFVEIKDLQPGTTYYYQLESKDADGPQVAKRTGSFTTWNIGPVTINDLTGHEATIRWTTNPATDSIIEYGTTTNLGQMSGKHGITSNHDVRLVHLESNQTYYGRIRLLNGDATSVSNIFSFKTLDASAGVSADTITINPEFSTDFVLSNFNFLDFPLQEQDSSDYQSSTGAVLAATDKDLFSVAGDFGSIVKNNSWMIWLCIPILLLVFLIMYVWIVHRHQRKTYRVEQDIARSNIDLKK